MNELRLNFVKVLVVDPKRPMLSLILDVLRAFGVGSVIGATNGAEAIQKLIGQAAAEVDIVITDIYMEPVDGAELLNWIRKNPESPNRFMPVIVLSGHTELPLIVRMRDLGATEIMARPMTVTGLSRRLVTVIDRARRFVEIESYFGPDRRRRMVPYSGEERRKENKGG